LWSMSGPSETRHGPDSVLSILPTRGTLSGCAVEHLTEDDPSVALGCSSELTDSGGGDVRDARSDFGERFFQPIRPAGHERPTARALQLNLQLLSRRDGEADLRGGATVTDLFRRQETRASKAREGCQRGEGRVKFSERPPGSPKLPPMAFSAK
jgi:hypothetical protein